MPPHKSTSVTLFEDKIVPAGEPRTVIVFGVMRGGTSMIAGAVRGLGVFMGEDLPVNNEDPHFTYKGVPQMTATAEARNAAHANWGWKFPMAAVYLEALLPALRNPIFIIVARDFAATAGALARYHSRDMSAAIAEAMSQTQKNVSLARRCQMPTMFVSYERSVEEPEKFLAELSDFVKLPVAVDTAKLLAFMARGSYKSFDEIVLGAAPKAAPAAKAGKG